MCHRYYLTILCLGLLVSDDSGMGVGFTGLDEENQPLNHPPLLSLALDFVASPKL